MFGFMKKHGSEKDKEEKERRKLEKKAKKQERTDSKKVKKPLTTEELQRLEDAKKGLFRRFSDAAARSGSKPTTQDGMAVAYREPGTETDSSPSETSSISSPSMENIVGSSSSHQISDKSFPLSKPHKPPPIAPKPDHKPKRGILKGKSSYGPEIPNMGVVGNLDDTITLEQNTALNELLSGEVGVKGKQNGDIPPEGHEPQAKTDAPHHPQRKSPRKLNTSNYKPVIPKFDAPPPPANLPHQAIEDIKAEPFSPPSPSEKTFGGEELHLPDIVAPRCPKPREIELRRQAAGDFGFTLRRGIVLERSGDDDKERKKVVIFAEPGPKNNDTGLLPGDRLVGINDENVENAPREIIIDIIKNSGSTIKLRVQPIPELSELSLRSGIDGGEVHIQDQSVKTGTLQRSGSMRFKSRNAKTEDQVASDKAWMKAEKVWLVHKGGFTGAKVIHSDQDSELAEGRCKVKLDYNDKILEVDEDDVEKANPPQFDRVEDLASLRHLNESGLLHTLRQRYGSNLIHTYGGQSLIVVNPMHPLSIYSEKVMQMFRGCRQEDMPPHIYATAQTAYRNMLASRHDQSIVLMGRSGSGKTASTRHMLQYLVHTAGTINSMLTVEKLNCIFKLLDAFGNSRSVMNTSASKFTHIFSLDFDHAGQIGAASIQVMMLDKSRIVKRPEGEPTFHAFYQMLAGIDSQLRNELQLQNLSEPNMFMTPLQRQEDRQRATQAWGKIHAALTLLGVSEAEEKALVACMAAIYHLGVAAVAKGTNNKYQFGRPAAAQKAATVLGTTVEELSRCIFAPPPQVQSKYRSPSHDKNTTAESLHGIEALEGFVVGLYSEVFYALVSLINRNLSSNYRTVSSMLILDTPGFQNPSSVGRQVGATFEDLCHNYVQERLQLLFHDSVFTSQQDLYAQENIECDFELVTSSPAAMVALIDKPPVQTVVRHDSSNRDDHGLLWLLDEEAIYPGSNEQTFIEKLFGTHATVPEKRGSLLKKGTAPGHFVLNHFQGTNPVQYGIKGWLKSSRENPISRIVNGFLLDSKKEEISGLFSTVRGPISTMTGGSVVGIDGSSSLRRASSIRRSCTTGAAGLKRKSVALQIKFQMDSIVDILRRTTVHFVHCLLPQNNAGLCDLRAAMMTPNQPPTEDIMLNVPLVRAQVRGAEIVEAIRIHRQGFPEHMLFSEFRHRFDILVSPELKPATPVADDKQAVEQLLGHLEIANSTYRIGLSQVFFRAGGLAQLEDARDEKITGTITALQAYCRGYLGRQKLKKLKVQHLAASCIQRNVQKFMAIRNWPWWRLYLKLQPVLNVHRTEEELRNKDVELEQLKTKVEKLEKERNDYKHAADRFENKLSEMTADFAEEHTTSTQATELLEDETSQRIRLEKELKDMQGKYAALQRKHEMTEMDLMQTRLLAASLDGEIDEDDDEGGSIYREKYERARRELDFMKKKMQQQHEEELEQKDTNKKQLERKLCEAVNEREEQVRVIQNLKRKSQRLNADMQDMKLHLEEQVKRNSDLEKKQRKFDQEKQKVEHTLKEEKIQREKLQRSRDETGAAKFTIEQELKNTKMDLEISVEKVKRLEIELAELSDSSATQEGKDSMQLKRIRTELESKMQEQEEELDEQAGTIQQLEQTKLRLEMEQERLRQQHSRELEEKETELEEMRASSQKKLRTLEAQIEEEYAEKQGAMKEKRELERKLQEASEMRPVVNRDVEKRLRRDLKRTRALLQDAQMMLDRQKEGAGRSVVKQLRNQLEDAEFATAAAVKARKGCEMEVADLQQQLDEVLKSKQEAEERCLAITREKNDLQSALEENEEDMAEIMKKYKALIQQQTADHITLADQSKQIEDLQTERQLLNEQIASLTSSMEYLQGSTVDKQVVIRLEMKIRDLESRLDLEQTTRHRAEVQLSRVKEQLEKLTEEKDALASTGSRHNEECKRLQRQLRESKEEHADLERKEADASTRKHDLEMKVESLERDYEQSQADLRLAFKRIADLQCVIEEEMESGEDSEYYTDADDGDTEDETDDSDDGEDFETFLVNHTRGGLSKRLTRSSNSPEDGPSSSRRFSDASGDEGDLNISSELTATESAQNSIVSDGDR